MPGRVTASEFFITANNITSLFVPRASPTLTRTATAATLNATSVSTTSLSVGSNSMTVGAGGTAGRVVGVSVDHAMILRGDATGILNPEYTITPGDVCSFIEWGGTWRFRQIQSGFNSIRLEITPTAVNVPTALQIGGVSTDTLYMARPWVQCVVNGNTAIQPSSDIGRVTPTITRTSGQAVGAYDITFSVHPRGFNYTYCLQPRVDTGLAFAVVSNVNTSSLKVRTHKAAQALTDLQFSITIFS